MFYLGEQKEKKKAKYFEEAYHGEDSLTQKNEP